MEAARNAVQKITGRVGHRTDVDEVISPAVTSETVKPHRHEETTEAIDREVHQHHYHTTVQPVSHQETLPEKHTHNIIPQVKREFKHDNEAETHQRVSAELGQFTNTSTTHQTTQSRQAAPQVVGEHVHHHVHETVQPVIHKETIQPEVVHTTVPIHETHHETSKHHGLSALPMKTLDEFTSAGGIITGNKGSTSHEQYEGAPRPYNEKLRTTIDKVLPGHHGSHDTSSTTGMGRPDSGVSGMGQETLGHGSNRTGTSGMGQETLGHDSNRTGTSGMGQETLGHGSNRTGTSGMGHESSGYGAGSGTTGMGHESSGYGSGTGRATMGDKMNPRVDADRDGRAGVMD